MLAEIDGDADGTIGLKEFANAVNARAHSPTKSAAAGTGLAPFMAPVLASIPEAAADPVAMHVGAIDPVATYVGAIDQGTSSTRFLILDKEGSVVAKSQV